MALWDVSKTFWDLVNTFTAGGIFKNAKFCIEKKWNFWLFEGVSTQSTRLLTRQNSRFRLKNERRIECIHSQALNASANAWNLQFLGVWEISVATTIILVVGSERVNWFFENLLSDTPELIRTLRWLPFRKNFHKKEIVTPKRLFPTCSKRYHLFYTSFTYVLLHKS